MAKDRDWRLGVLALHLGRPMGAVYACALGVQIEKPFFWGDATVRTEQDNVITCNLTTREGEVVFNAAIDTFDKMQDHMRKTADFLKLDDEERTEFLAKMNEWIQAPFIVGAKFFTWEG